MNIEQAKSYLQKYNNGTASDEEKAFVESWLLEYDLDGREILEQELKDNDLAEIHSNLMLLTHTPVIRKKLWLRVAVTAAAVVTITLGTWLYQTFDTAQKTAATHLFANDIAPGAEGATLTLANGKTIKLTSTTNGELIKEAGVRITKTADGQLTYEIDPQAIPDPIDQQKKRTNTLSTAKGETYQVKLPDGTLVWLNAMSSLTYTSTLQIANKRIVQLEGEGYFEVAKNPNAPFIVENKGQKIEVLGTHFNVNAYADEAKVLTTLVEGSVRVSTSNRRTEASSAKREIVLRPGEQASLSPTTLSVNVVNTAPFTAWQQGNFIFNDEGIESIMRKLVRWYNIEVVYDGEIPKGEFSGDISRNKSISQVLLALQSTKLVHFEIKGRKVRVMK